MRTAGTIGQVYNKKMEHKKHKLEDAIEDTPIFSAVHDLANILLERAELYKNRTKAQNMRVEANKLHELAYLMSN